MTDRRIALFGGSFNPIHWGHIRLARRVLVDGWADEVWLLVSPQNPLKQQASLADEQLRLQWAQQAVANEPGITASDFEFHLPRPSYTWHTLCALTQTYPDREFSLLIGADNWLHFDRWAHTEDILSHHQILVYPRPGYPLPHPLPAGVHEIEAPLFPFASTDIRQAILRGEDISSLVPESIIPSVTSTYGAP